MISKIFPFVLGWSNANTTSIFILEDGEVCLTKANGTSHKLGLKMFTVDKSFALEQYFGTIFPLSYDKKPKGLGIQTLGQGANILLVVQSSNNFKKLSGTR